MNKKKAAFVLIALLILVSVVAACTIRSGDIQKLGAAVTDEPHAEATLMPTTEPTPTENLLIIDHGVPDSELSSQGNGEPITDNDETTNNMPAPVETTPKPSPAPTVTTKPTTAPAVPPALANTAQPTQPSTPTPAAPSMPVPTQPPAPTPDPTPEQHQSRTICNICGADITGNVPAHGKTHLLNDEDFSYHVE